MGYDDDTYMYMTKRSGSPRGHKAVACHFPYHDVWMPSSVLCSAVESTCTTEFACHSQPDQAEVQCMRACVI